MPESGRRGLQCELPNCMHAHNVEAARFPPGIVLNGCEHCRNEWGATTVA